MIISKIEIRAFKSIYELTLPLDPHINVLIGANESGKSNILKAIEAFRDKVALDASFTCQYSNHYYLAKAPELALEFSSFTKENRRPLQLLSEAFKEIDQFTIRKAISFQLYEVVFDLYTVRTNVLHGRRTHLSGDQG